MERNNCYRTEKLENLRSLLHELSKFHGAKSHFVRNFSKETGKEFHRNFANKIINGEINFQKNLHEYLDSAISIATNIQLVYLRREKAKKSSIYREVDPKKIHLFIDEQLSIAQSLWNEKAYYSAFELLCHCSKMVSVEKLKELSPHLYGRFCLLYSTAAVNLGQNDEHNNNFFLLKESINTFKGLNDLPNMFKAYEMLRIFIRHAGHNIYIVRKFKEDWDALSSKILSSEERKSFEMQILHQNAISLMKAAKNSLKAENFLQESERLFIYTNKYFQYTNNEAWFRHVRIREAELYMKSDQFHKADSILGNYEDYCELSALPDLQKSIFFRVNCEKYLKLNDIESAIKNFNASSNIALERKFQNELKFLTDLKNSYSLLQTNLSQNFSKT